MGRAATYGIAATSDRPRPYLGVMPTVRSRESVEFLGHRERAPLDQRACHLEHRLTVVSSDGAFLNYQKGRGYAHEQPEGEAALG